MSMNKFKKGDHLVSYSVLIDGADLKVVREASRVRQVDDQGLYHLTCGPVTSVGSAEYVHEHYCLEPDSEEFRTEVIRDFMAGCADSVSAKETEIAELKTLYWKARDKL